MPIWEQIKEQYDAKEFLQIETDLKRIKRIEYLYDYERFQTDFNALMKKAYLNCLFVNDKTLIENLERFVKDTDKTMPFYEREKSVPVELIDMSGNALHYKLKNGELKDAKLPLSVTRMDDIALLYHVDKLENEIKKDNASDLTHKQYKLAYDEAIRRKLIDRCEVSK